MDRESLRNPALNQWFSNFAGDPLVLTLNKISSLYNRSTSTAPPRSKFQSSTCRQLPSPKPESVDLLATWTCGTWLWCEVTAQQSINLFTDAENAVVAHDPRLRTSALNERCSIPQLITRASFCCSNKARKLHLFSAKVAFMRTFDCERLESTYFACKNRKSCKSCNTQFLETAQNIELYISWVFRKL